MKLTWFSMECTWFDMVSRTSLQCLVHEIYDMHVRLNHLFQSSAWSNKPRIQICKRYMYLLLFAWKYPSIFLLLLGIVSVSSCCEGLYAAQRFIIGASLKKSGHFPGHFKESSTVKVGTASPWPCLGSIRYISLMRA